MGYEGWLLRGVRLTRISKAQGAQSTNVQGSYLKVIELSHSPVSPVRHIVRLSTSRRSKIQNILGASTSNRKVCASVPSVDCSSEKRSNAQTHTSFCELPHLTFNVVREFLSMRNNFSCVKNDICGFWLVVDSISPTCPRASRSLKNGTKNQVSMASKGVPESREGCIQVIKTKISITPPIRRKPDA